MGFTTDFFTTKLRVFGTSNFFKDIINETGSFFSYEHMDTVPPEDKLFFITEIQPGNEGVYSVEINHKVRLVLDAIGLFFNDDTVDFQHIIRVVRPDNTVDTIITNLLTAQVIGTVRGSGIYTSNYITFNEQETFTLNQGDRLYSYFTWLVTDDSAQVANILNRIEFDDETLNYIRITAETVFQQTTAEVFQIGEAAQSILSQITNQDQVW